MRKPKKQKKPLNIRTFREAARNVRPRGNQTPHLAAAKVRA
jgi:hypothetical protein